MVKGVESIRPPQNEIEEAKEQFRDELDLDEKFPLFSPETRETFLNMVSTHSCILTKMLDVEKPPAETRERLPHGFGMGIDVNYNSVRKYGTAPLMFSERLLGKYLGAIEHREDSPYEWEQAIIQIAGKMAHEYRHLKQLKENPIAFLDDTYENSEDVRKYGNSSSEEEARLFEIWYLLKQPVRDFSLGATKALEIGELTLTHLKYAFEEKFPNLYEKASTCALKLTEKIPAATEATSPKTDTAPILNGFQ